MLQKINLGNGLLILFPSEIQDGIKMAATGESNFVSEDEFIVFRMK